MSDSFFSVLSRYYVNEIKTLSSASFVVHNGCSA